MLALLELESGVTAAVLVVQIFHFPLKRNKEAQVNKRNLTGIFSSNSVSQLLTFPPQAHEVFPKSAVVTRISR